MRLSRPRIEPVSLETFHAHPGPGGQRPRTSTPVNIVRMWLRYPKLMKAHHALGEHFLGPDATLPRRERELGIMRMGVLRGSEYEFAQHRAFNLEDGLLTDEEVRRVVEGPDWPGWTRFEAAVLRAVDEMHDDAFISDLTWATLSDVWSDEQMMDFIALMGRYWMVATLLNSVGVQLEEGRSGFPEPQPSGP